MTKLNIQSTIFNHMQKIGSISIREAMDDYSVSGGHLTKIVSVLRRQGHIIHTAMCKHPITGRRSARYHLFDVYKPVDKPVDKPVTDVVTVGDFSPLPAGTIVEMVKPISGVGEGSGKTLKL